LTGDVERVRHGERLTIDQVRQGFPFDVLHHYEAELS
jgi:hypothetical protein